MSSMRDDAIVNHAKALGFKFPEDTDFLWLAVESLEVGLPEHWQQVVSEEGDGSLFFYNSDTDISQWSHPLDADYRTRLKDLRAQRTKKKKRSKKKQKKRKKRNAENSNGGGGSGTKMGSPASSRNSATSPSRTAPSNSKFPHVKHFLNQFVLDGKGVWGRGRSVARGG